MRCKNYCGVACVDGSCPVANREEYAERGYDIVHNCNECIHYNGCEDCAMDGTYCIDKSMYATEEHISEWDKMTEEEKYDFCSHCGCAYFFFSDVNQCMYDSDEFPFDTERPCLLLKHNKE